MFEAVGVVDVEVGWQWNVVVVGVVNCKLPVEVCCLEVAADEGLVVIELKVGAVPGHLHRGAVTTCLPAVQICEPPTAMPCRLFLDMLDSMAS